jgi:predicted small secreted protein
MKRMLWLAGLLGFVLLFSGCNTIRGMGEDIQWTGEQIQNAVN